MARKSNKKYSFQRNKKKTLAWIIGVIAVIAVIAIGIVVYNNSTSGDIQITAPAAESLNNIAENWRVLETHTDKILNYYSGSEDGTDGNGGAMLGFLNSEYTDMVYIYIKPENYFDVIENAGVYARPNIFSVDLAQLFSGAIALNETTVALQAGNENCMIYLEDYDAEKLDDSALHGVIAELEAIIAEGPVVTKEPVEETTETVEETTEAAE